MYWLQPHESFPDPALADEHGLLAIGGDLSQNRLLSAYRQGIFPWYEEDEPLLWWSPDPRMVLFPASIRITKSMKKLLRDEVFSLTYNQHFEEVIRNCAMIKRKGQEGTWITDEMIQAYIDLRQSGYAQSVEVWQDHELVGGLYGVYLREQQVFCGESMFAKVSNASKYGFIRLVQQLEKEGVKLIDCQVYTSHLHRLGAQEIPRKEFLAYLQGNIEAGK